MLGTPDLFLQACRRSHAWEASLGAVKGEQLKQMGKGWHWGAEGQRGLLEAKSNSAPQAAPSQAALSDSYLSVTPSIKNTNSVKSHQAEMSLLLIMRSLTCSDSS